MGCAKSTQNGDSNGGGKKAIGLDEQPPPPGTDPRLPLTAKQKYSMVASWKGIARALEPTGIYMFLR